MKEIDPRFFFNGGLPQELSVKHILLRSEVEYDNDGSAELTALKALKHLIQDYSGNRYLLTVSSDTAPKSKLRSKKGILWGYKELQCLDHRQSEVSTHNDNVRLYALVDLKDFDFNSSPVTILNWISSLIVLTPLDLDELQSKAERWIDSNENIIPYDFNVIAKDLLFMGTGMVIRYFPAENGRNEVFAFIGCKEEIKHFHIENINLKETMS